ncbi:MAG TPA: hypothetical protein VIG33_04000 [Pseudobdellovibrionaceae bacterium]|jgi:hypothetical protein
MSILRSDTGNNPEKERSVGGLIYLIITAAVFIAIIIFWVMGANKNLNPKKSGDTTKSAPDKTPQTGASPSTLSPASGDQNVNP